MTTNPIKPPLSGTQKTPDALHSDNTGGGNLPIDHSNYNPEIVGVIMTFAVTAFLIFTSSLV